ncbi:MAG: inorganic phosphate transporter [Clostridia bacterium]|nr:inorganic phosphate transporter [Clostridia bacterium]
MEAFVFICALMMIFVNGATDTPGCIAGAVVSGSLSYTKGVTLCAVGNVLGTVISCVLFPRVARTVVFLADLPDYGIAAALIAAIAFSAAAWVFGIPTSESHGLIASLGGVSLCIKGHVGVSFGRMAVFSFLSCGVGALAGCFMMVLMRCTSLSGKEYRNVMCFSALGSSFCHGMQDGQKFAAILALSVAGGFLSTRFVLIAAAVLGFGCFFGGKKMVCKLGYDLAGEFCAPEAVASDIAALICTVLSSLAGIPVSTTYMKTFAMVGAAAPEKRKADVKTLCELTVTWVLTYPVCVALAYVLCEVLYSLM